jgi:hypothetical protein
MTDVVRREPGPSGLALVLSAWHDPAARILNVDLVTVLIALLLPWSTTGVVIAAALWVIALVPTLEIGAFWRSLKRPICVLPVAMFALALVGTLWSEAPWSERLYAVGPTVKLLALPLLLYHGERSPRGVWVFIAFLVSCLLLMVASWLVALDPDLSLKLYFSRGPYKVASGIAVKNYIDQSQEFVLCAVALAYPVMTSLRTLQNLAGGAVCGHRRKFADQHDVRGHLTHGAGDDADHARGVRAAAFAMAHGDGRVVRGRLAGGGGLERLAATARNRREISC